MGGYDAIVIVAGYNGLAAASVLAENGFKVACVEQTSAPGGKARRQGAVKGVQ